MKRAMMIVFAITLVGGVLLAQTPQQTAPTTSQEPPASTLPQTTTPPQTSIPQTATPPSSAPAQSGTATQSATNEQNAAHISPGSIIPVRLAKTVDAKKAKQGDEVVATVPGDLKSTTGQIVVPKDTKIIGHVTEAQKRSKEQKESQLGIAFNQMTMNGQQVQLPLSIQAIVASPKNNATAAENQAPGAASSGSSNYPSGGGRGGAMGGNTSAPNTPSSGESAPNTNNPQAQAAPNPPITEATKGMVGFKDMNLGAPDANNGSVVTSEKNNVKLEDGTLMLLRVSPAAQQNQPAPQTQQTPQQK